MSAAPRIDVKPLSLSSAHAACDRWHSHHEPAVGGLFALAAWVDDRCVCVAVVSRPVARRLDDGKTAEVVRLASDATTRRAASSTLRAVVVECASRGYDRVVSYTMLGEVGACYRAARWRPTALTRGGEWSCPSRPRKPSKQPGRKARWEAGARAAPRSLTAQRAIESHAGQIALAKRAPAQPELMLGVYGEEGER
jgi:hypothetical protein